MKLSTWHDQEALTEFERTHVSIYGGFLLRCPTCGYLWLRRDGNVLFDRRRLDDQGRVKPLGWSSTACYFNDCESSITPLTLQEHEPYLAVFLLQGMEGVAELCELANVGKRPPLRKL